jgi:nitrate reductase gamma subunit
MNSTLTADFFWGVYPYVCFTLFVFVPIIRMIYRPFGITTRATSLFTRDVLGAASLLLHWGLFLILLGHLAGFVGGLLGRQGWVGFFYWAALVGGFSALLGSIIALVRRVTNPEVRALSQWDDYLVHLFLIAIMALALYQVTANRVFGVAYTASSWLASVCLLAPQPELMASASLISKWHVFLALTFFALFPFTKLVHFWTLPVNYFVRPYQSVRTNRFKFQRQWEYALRTDKSYLIYGLAGVIVFFVGFSLLLGRGGTNGGAATPVHPAGKLAGTPLYVSQCARCHGVHGDGRGEGASSPTLATLPRDLTRGQYAFISTDNGVASDQDLTRTIRAGLVPAGMPAFAELDERQIASLVAETRRFASAAGVQPGATLTVPSQPPQANAKQGRELFVQVCAACHGESGRGDNPNLAAMRGFSDRPLRPRDLTRPALYKVGTDPEQLYLRIAAGIPPMMPPFRQIYRPEQIWSIVLYLRESLMSTIPPGN